MSYSCAFTAHDASVAYRPPRITPRPVVQGPQTAIVTGSGNEEIWTDKFGRVKVHFNWDRHGPCNEESSCWVRVAQSCAGKSWGSQFIPRVGHEVVVEFLEGDPDRPLITGTVYNAVQTPAFELPDSKEISGIRTNSTNNAGNFNAIAFNDKDGAEEVWIRAARDRRDHVEHDLYSRVLHDRHQVVENCAFEEIKHDCHQVVDGERRDRVKKDYHRIVEGKVLDEVRGSVDYTAGAVTQSLTSRTIDIAGDDVCKAANITLEATGTITLKCGGSEISISPGGIMISSPSVTVSAGGNVTVSAAGTTIGSPQVNVAAATTSCTGVMQAATVIATAAVVSPSYTPGAGNVM